MGGSHVGPLFQEILVEQFLALRDGDAYSFEHLYDDRERRALAGVRLSDVIRRNTDIGGELPDDVFHVR